MNGARNSRVLYSAAVFTISILIVVLMVGVLGAHDDEINQAEEINISVDEADWSGQSNSPSTWYGESVRSAGDVNGDGYDDAIVGAVNYDGGSTDSGRAYLYYGSADGLSETPDRIFDPPQVEFGGFFGGMATTAGDVNNDGYSDIIISMVNYGGNDEGAVFLWYGSENGPTQNYNWMARGNATYAHMGWDIGTAGDVNGDNYDDIIVGVYQYDGGSQSHAYVWYGTEDGPISGTFGLPSNASWSATTDQHCGAGETNCSAFGTRLGTAGDVNGDGYDDIFVGAPRYDSGQVDEGKVFVWYGTANGPISGTLGLPSNASWTAESNQAGAMLTGWDRSYMTNGGRAAGDVNNDGYDDLILGADYYNNGQTNEGAAFVWLGSEDGLNEGINGDPSNVHWMAESNQEGALMGREVSSAGDFNGDGYDDVLIGAYAYDITGTTTITNGGQIMIWHGSSQGLGPDGTPANADWTAASDQVGSYLGYSVGSLGDINDDGVDDVIAGAPLYDNPEINEGMAFAFYPTDPIIGLNAASSSPTLIGNSTYFTATVTGGSDITYQWDFGDTLTGTGQYVSHIYESAGVYTVTVEATNWSDSESVSLLVEVNNYFMYFPMVVNKE